MFGILILAGTIMALTLFQAGAFKLMIAGAVLGLLRTRLPATSGMNAAGHLITGWMRG